MDYYLFNSTAPVNAPDQSLPKQRRKRSSEIITNLASTNLLNTPNMRGNIDQINKNIENIPLMQLEDDLIFEKPLKIGIAGGVHSGKSSAVDEIKDTLSQHKIRVTVINLTSFYKCPKEKLKELKGKQLEEYLIKYLFEPTCKDWKALEDVLQRLTKRETVKRKCWDRSNNITFFEQVWQPADVLILEGGELFYTKEIGSQIDIKIFLDTDSDLRVSKRMHIQVIKQKKSLQDSVEEYLDYIKPAYEKYVEPTKRFADIIIPNYQSESLHLLFSEEQLQSKQHMQPQRNMALKIIAEQVNGQHMQTKTTGKTPQKNEIKKKIKQQQSQDFDKEKQEETKQEEDNS